MEEEKPLLINRTIQPQRFSTTTNRKSNVIIPIDCLFEITKFLTDKQIRPLEMINKTFYEGIWLILYHRKQGEKFMGDSLFITPQEYMKKLKRHSNPKKLFVSYLESINELCRKCSEREISRNIEEEFIKNHKAPFHDRLRFYSKQTDPIVGFSFSYWKLVSNSIRQDIRKRKNRKHLGRALIITPSLICIGVLMFFLGIGFVNKSLGAGIALIIGGVLLCLPGCCFCCGVYIKSPSKFKEMMKSTENICCD